jgi:UDP-2-acetamido-2,6-beta-L-arabino-hexul-4-ose reductase
MEMSKESIKILVTGAKGFIGKNLVAGLKYSKISQIFEYDTDNDPADLDIFTKECDIVFHLAGVNRPEKTEDFRKGNYNFTVALIDCLKKNNNKAPVIFSSSAQAVLDNDYGKSKLAAERLLNEYSKYSGVPVTVYRLSNVFGKWCRPSYNSVVATFCHNIANGLPVTINDPAAIVNLLYIDDVVSEFLSSATLYKTINGYRLIENLEPVYSFALKSLAELIGSFKNSREDKMIPDTGDHFTRKLYATYLTYLPANGFKYPLKMNIDERGSFTEFIRTPDRGQVSVNISRPGIVKGNHWHNTKNEKFLVVRGNGVIRLRKCDSSEIIEYDVSGDKLEVVDIPPGYTHNIENTGNDDMVTVMWSSEVFNPEKADTIFEAV